MLKQCLEQSQRLALSQSMQQSLQCLALPVQDLCSFLEEAALSNPLLEVETPRPETLETGQAVNAAEERIPLEFRDEPFRSRRREPDGGSDFTALVSHPPTFAEYLNEQLGQMRQLSGEMLELCRFLVGCLNSAGYLDCPLEELAAEAGESTFHMEQALFVVQALDPPGTGARSLEECLLLQLAQTKEFTELNIHLIRSGLPLLAEKDYTALSRQLNAPPAKIRRAAEVIRSLNPIPSRGFYTETPTSYVVPEAAIRVENNRIIVEMNDRALPRVSLDSSYCAMLGNADCREAQPYLREKMAEAKGLMGNLQKRRSTMARLLEAVTRIQRDYFLCGKPLVPMTMRQLAEELELNFSTVSRAVREKYIEYGGKVIPLRSLFSASLQTTDMGVVSAESAKQQLRRFISAEDSRSPLSDEALSDALASVGILISRRTVAKYRSALGIPTASARKQPVEKARRESAALPARGK